MPTFLDLSVIELQCCEEMYPDRLYYEYGLPYEVVLFDLAHYIVPVFFNVTQK